jgi:formylglycine-generating enzyme required for sulfatase activity
VHQVTISRPFCIGKYEVTQAEYQAVMNANPSYFQGAAWPTSADRPVELVSWHGAMAYCAALTAREAAAGRLPAGYQYRLPTEAEWEYCCRAGTTTEFHYGNSLDCSQAKFGYSYHTSSSCSSSSTNVVGGYAPNAWGLFDMHGNVWEWCLDWWDGSVNYPSSLVVDPHVSNSGSYRVIRGGSWLLNSNFCRSASRFWNFPARRSFYLGFRVVLAPVLV